MTTKKRKAPATAKRKPAKPAVKRKTTAKATKPAPRASSAPKLDRPDASFYPYGIERHGDLPWHVAHFERLIRKFSEDERKKLMDAYAFARERHERCVRKDGSPFIIHPVRIANILMAEWSVREPRILIAALLHDVIEDTQTTIREVKDAFGDEVGKLVDGLTMWPGSETQEIYLKRVSRGPQELRLIKCADILDNLRSWHECNDVFADRYPRWWRQANEYALPMAEDTLTAAAGRIREIVEDKWYLEKAKML